MAKLLLIIAFLMPNMAHAYVDPGTGILFWQGLIAGIGGAVIFFRKPAHFLKRWWVRIRSSTHRDEAS